MTSVTAAERAEIRMMARELARRELIPGAAGLDRGEEAVLAGCWSHLVEAGLDRALLSERHGGVELDVLDLLAAIEELAVGDGGVAMCVLLCNAALATLTDEQLADVPWGARWALVPATPELELTVSGGVLSGRLACALGAHGAHGLVFLLDGPEPVTLAVDAGSAGLKLERDLAQMGLRAAPAASIELAGVDCQPVPSRGGRPSGYAPDSDGPADSTNGSDGSKGTMSAAGAWALLHAGTAAIAHGIARRAHEMALEYAHARRQGGVAIIEHDAVADMLSAMAVRLACRPAIIAERSGPEIDPAHPDGHTQGAYPPSRGAGGTLTGIPKGHTPHRGGQAAVSQALAAKIAATDAAVATTTDAVQVFGGTGYMVETGIEKLMRDAKYCQLFPECNWVAHDELMRAARGGRGSFAS